jgi:mono/diheme cytochrome c family protein
MDENYADHRPTRHSVLLLLLVALSGAFRAFPVEAQDNPDKIWQGVYTDAQADHGKERFTSVCRRCHNDDLGGSERGPALRGERFMMNWELQAINRLFSKIRDTMPPDSPSSLSDDDYVDVVSHILRANGYPAGRDTLKLDDLENISIVSKAGEGPRKAPNFVLVQVVGCLMPGSGNAWTLTRATEPVPTGDQPSTPQMLREAEARALGSETFRLISVGSFAPESHQGQKMQAKGLLYRAPDKLLLNVISLEPVGSACGTLAVSRPDHGTKP